MRIYNYLNNKGVAETYKIYKVVMSLASYAKVNYKNNWEDALDEAFFHILDNFDSSKGELEHYAMKIVSTIMLGKYKKEIVDGEETNKRLDLNSSAGETIYDTIIDTDIKSSEVVKCVSELVPYFVSDFKFFETGLVKNRKLKYTDIFNKYSDGCIILAKNYLLKNYSELVRGFLEYQKIANIKSFSSDRYLKSSVEGVKFVSNINGIVLVKRGTYHMKGVAYFSIKDSLELIHKLFYSEDSNTVIEIEGVKSYISISGKIANSLEELNDLLENELVGSVLCRTSLKVFEYVRGKELYFATIKKDRHNDIVLNIFNTEVVFSFKNLVVKEIIC